MSKSYPSQTSFNGGVQSPLIRGMVDAPRGASSFQASNNMVPMKYGPIARRGGTEFIAQTQGNTGDDKRVQIVPFNYNDEQAYILEFSSSASSVMKVYKDKSLVLESEAELNQEVQSIPAISGGSDIVVNVDGTGTDYTVGRQAVLSGLEEAHYLGGGTFTITATGASSVSLSNVQHTTAETTSGATLSQVYELTIPYTTSDMFASDGTFRLDVKQYNDVMYLCHPDYQTRILTRAGHDDWSLTVATFDFGPFLPENANEDHYLECTRWRTESGLGDMPISTITSITKQGNFGAETAKDLFSASDVLAEASGGIAGSGGTSTEDGRMMAIFATISYDQNINALVGHRWKYVKIVKYISASEVWVTKADDEPGWNVPGSGHYEGEFQPVNHRSPKKWAMGAFSTTSGFASVTEIHNGRIILGKTTAEPDTLHFSASGGYSTTGFEFQTKERDGQVYDDLGFSVNISGGNASPIQWISSTSDGVAVGTYSSEGMVGPSDRAKGFVPGNVSYRRNTSVGSKSIQPVMIDQSTLFVSRTGRRLHQLTYDLATAGQKSPDLTEIAEHVTKTGIIDFAWQREPRDTLWCVLSDGKLIGFTFDSNNEISAWHQHELGGDAPRVRSVASIPSNDGSSDELWLAVDREGKTTGAYSVSTFRSIEVMTTDIVSNIEKPIDSRFFDSFIEISTPVKTGVINALFNRIDTDTSHGFSEDDVVFFSSVDFRSEDKEKNSGLAKNATGIDLANHRFDNMYFKVSAPVSSSTFRLKTLTGNAVDITDIALQDGALTFGNAPLPRVCSVQKCESTFNASYLFGGETIDALVDGRKHVRVYVQGSIDTDIRYSDSANTENGAEYYANLVIGYPYTSFVELQNIEAGDTRGSTQGMIKKINKVMVRVLNSLGLKYGPSEDRLEEHDFDYDQELSEYRDLKSEDVVLSWPEGYEQSCTIRLQGDGPYPLQIQSVTAEMETKGFSSNR